MSAVMSASITEPTRRGAPPEETRRRIEDVAERLFRTMGYQKTAVADIARELGMSPANVYRFFPSKSAINQVIAARMLGGVDEEIQAIARRPGPAPERLKDIVRTLHRRHLALFFTEKRLHDMVTAAMAEHWAVIAQFIAAVEAAYARVLADGMAEGSVAPCDPVATARTIKLISLPFVHPVMIAECIHRQETEDRMAFDLEAALDLVVRGLRP
jgi:AcrR family transcriptional regulator